MNASQNQPESLLSRLPSTAGWFLVESIGFIDRGAANKGPVYRVILVHVIERDGGYHAGQWHPQGVYFTSVGSADFRPIHEISNWDGLRIIPLDLSVLAAAAPR